MSARGEGVSVMHWRRSSSTGMHYYEDNRNGYGYVQQHDLPGDDGSGRSKPMYLAVVYGESGTFASLKAGKAFVERAWRSQAKKRPMSAKPCRPWCGKRCPSIGQSHCFHTEKYPLRFCRAKCRDAWEASKGGPSSSSPKPTTLKAVTVEVLTCNHCGKYAVTLDGYRVTAHKCRGQWTAVHTEKTTDIRPSWKRP